MEELNCSPNIIQKVLKEANVSIRSSRSDKGSKVPKCEAKKRAAVPIIHELCDQGKTMTEIRAIVGISMKFVSTTVKNYKGVKT